MKTILHVVDVEAAPAEVHGVQQRRRPRHRRRLKPPAEGMPPYWGVYFAVDDCDAAVATAEQAGASVLMPATDMEGVGRMSALQDPQGAVFFVMTNANPTS